MEVFVHVGHFGGFEHLKDEHGVVSCKRTSALGDDVGVRNVVLIGCLDEGVDNVVDVFLHTVVDRTFRVGRTRAVVVDPETATAVDELDIETHFAELDIILCHLAQGDADESDFGDLAADVEVNEAEAVAESLLFEEVEGLEQFGTVETELRGVAARTFPLAHGAAGELDADAEIGTNAHLLCSLRNDLQFVQLLDDKENALSHLLCEECKLDEVLIFVAVADNHGVGVHVGGQHGVQFGLGTALETKVVLLAVGDDFLDNGAHLIDLDGIDDEVLAAVVVFLLGTLEAIGGFLNAIVEDVGKTEQNGGGDVTFGQFVDQLAEVDANIVLARTDVGVTAFVDTEIVHAPTFDIIKFFGVFNTPFSHRKDRICRKKKFVL